MLGLDVTITIGSCRKYGVNRAESALRIDELMLAGHNMAEYAEKRDFLRMTIDCDLQVCVAAQQQFYPANIINLSSKGILFSCNEGFEIGTALEINLTPSNPLTPPMHGYATVSRVSDNESVFELACDLESLS